MKRQRNLWRVNDMTNPTNPNSHQYWSKTLQYQQRQGQHCQQGGGQKPQGRPQQQQQPKPQVKEGFNPELMDKDVEIEQAKSSNVVVMRGRVVDVSKYWLKIIVNGEVVYLNKAFVISIKPLVVKEPAGGDNGGEVSRQK
jgi:hypothetical protein